MGKSSLLVRYLAGCRDAGKHIVYLDFQSFTDTDLADYPILLQPHRGADFATARTGRAGRCASIESQIDFRQFHRGTMC